MDGIGADMRAHDVEGSKPPLSSLLTLLEFQSQPHIARQPSKEMVQRPDMAHFHAANSAYPVPVASVASLVKQGPMYPMAAAQQPDIQIPSVKQQAVPVSAVIPVNRSLYRSDHSPNNQAVNKFMRVSPQAHQIPAPQVLPRYVVRCTVSNGAQRYGAKLKLFGKQLRIGSKYADVMSASKVASSAKRFLRQDEITGDFYIEPSPHLSQLTCLVFCSRDTNEIKEVPVATVLHNFVRVSNIKSAHKRVSDSHFQGDRKGGITKVKTQPDNGGVLASMPVFRAANELSSHSDARGPGGSLLAWKVEGAQPGLDEPPAKRARTSPPGADSMTQAELMQRIHEMQKRFATPMPQRAPGANGGPLPLTVPPDQAYSAEDISLIYRHFCLIYEKVSMAHSMLSKFLQTSPELPFQSQKLAFTSLSCLQRVLTLLNPPSKKRPHPQQAQQGPPQTSV